MSPFVAGLSYATAALLVLCAYSQYVSPASVPYASLCGLLFPFALAGTLLIGAITLLFAPRKAWICGIALLACSPAIRAYCPVNFPSVAPKNALPVLSFNLHGWDSWWKHYALDDYVSPSALFIKKTDADIVCLQEANVAKKFLDKHVNPHLKAYRYRSTTHMDRSALTLYSKYPILREEEICQRVGNGAMAYWIKLSEGDTLLVVNCHLLSYGFSDAEKDNISACVQHRKAAGKRKEVVRMLKKVVKVSKYRAEMTDSISAFLSRHASESKIVCGDFNDTPVSYAHNRIGRGLKDAFVRTGNGIGRSYNEYSLVIRIDHMFCSPDWRPYDCTVRQDVKSSDHYPIEAYFKRTDR